MQDGYWKKLEHCLSPDRLAAFGRDAPGHRVVTARYLWNIAVCESLYAPIHLLEVGLRNAIDRAMVSHTASPNWYDIASLTPWGHEQVGKAKTGIARTKRPVTPGRVVAELHFGFWTSMFEHHFESAPAGFLPRGIKVTFPHMPKSLHNRKAIKADLDTIRKLRNRIFHHERIIHWNNLPEQHQSMLDFLSWMNPDLHELASLIDSFPAVYNAGIEPFLDRIDTHRTGKD
jgi:hypothetical protein